MCELDKNPAEYSSCSERQMVDNLKIILSNVMSEFTEWADRNGIETSKDDGVRFGFTISNYEIVKILFLFGTGHDGGASVLKKCRELGLVPDETTTFADERAFWNDDEENMDGIEAEWLEAEHKELVKELEERLKKGELK